MTPQEPAMGVSVDWLANVIRTADGNHSLGAGALAEKIVEALATLPHMQPAGEELNALRWLADELIRLCGLVPQGSISTPLVLDLINEALAKAATTPPQPSADAGDGDSVECPHAGAMRGDGKCPQCSQHHAIAAQREAQSA